MNLYVVIAADGTPKKVAVARGLGKGLDQQAVEAVRKWRFQPGTLEGKPVAVAINVKVNFRLQGASPPTDSVQDYRRLFANAQAAYSNHEFERCIELGQQIAENFPGSHSAWNLVGLAYLELGDPENARRAFLQEVKVDPESLYAYNNLGRALMLQKKLPEAMIQFRKELELNPKDQYAHSNFGHALLSLKEYSDAIPEFLLGIQAQPENASIRIQLAECYLNTGQHEKALNELQSAIGMASSASIWNSAAWTLAKSKTELERAQQYADTALAMDAASLKDISLDPLNGATFSHVSSFLSTMDSLGWIQFMRGDVDNGLKNLITAWQYCESPVVADHLAQVYGAKHDDKNAMRYSALALVAEKSVPFVSPDDEDAVSASNARLKLLTTSERAALLAAAQKEVEAQHTLNVPNAKRRSGDAEFAVVVGTHENTKARFVRGEESLRSVESPIVAALEARGDTFKLARWAQLHCDTSALQCSVTLLPARKAILAQLRKQSGAIQSGTPTLAARPTPVVFSSDGLGMRFTVPENWVKVHEEHPESFVDIVAFSKPGTLAMLTFQREYLQVNANTFLTRFEESLKNFAGYHRLSISTVARDGLEGSRLIFNANEKGVEWYGFIEVFTFGDQHYAVIGQSPIDMYSRYASEFDATMRSLSFPKQHGFPGDSR